MLAEVTAPLNDTPEPTIINSNLSLWVSTFHETSWGEWGGENDPGCSTVGRSGCIESTSINPGGGGLHSIHTFQTPAVFTFSSSLHLIAGINSMLLFLTATEAKQESNYSSDMCFCAKGEFLLPLCRPGSSGSVKQRDDFYCQRPFIHKAELNYLMIRNSTWDCFV